MATARQRMATGGYGEACAARHLVEHGMVVLDRNWRCDAGRDRPGAARRPGAGLLRGEDPVVARRSARRSRR